LTGGARGSGTGVGNSKDSCSSTDACRGPASNTMAAAADQALVGAVTKKLGKDIDVLSDKLKAEARL